MTNPTPAPPLTVSHWFNTRQPLNLAELRGKVVLLHAFQMLCPGCVSHALPQAAALHARSDPDQLAVIGIHSVFEHHAVMNADALQAFIHEYRIAYPVGIDAATPGNTIPQTMGTYGWRGTPTTVLIDRAGHVRLQHFGRLDDLQLGMAIGQLLGETATVATQAAGHSAAECDAHGCTLP